MRKLIITSLFIIIFISTSYGQCNITEGNNSDGYTYSAQKEVVYKDPRFETGIFAAMLNLDVIQSQTNHDLLAFYLKAYVMRKGNKPMVVPRRLNIKFSDGTSLSLISESIQDPLDRNGIIYYICEFRLDLNIYTQFQSKSVSEIMIIDNRSGESITCNPYSDLLKEQANCIANRLKK
ncbi:MAG: hypothetical protein NTU43_01685 [Bacteroidetes bacterium]|nr:hypothetical protein [Bacteroidota bacterium]